MAQEAGQISELLIEDEMKDAYLTFAMSVIVSRALPDVRDGLKPVQRRILVAMNELNLGPRAQTRKCGKIVGDVHGNYHPHGEGAIYDALVRMAQPFSTRYPHVDSQGNFGSMDGDPPAAQRYTEARLTASGMEMLRDLELDTVTLAENYDGTRQEPVVLPARLPNLLVNGATGIAVGMSTSIPPHNLREICDAAIAVMDNPEISIRELMRIVPGPDFPTGGILCGRQGIYDGYATGRGTVILRARTRFEELRDGRRNIVVTEAPYRSNRDALMEGIAAAVQAGRVQDVQDVRNESDKSGTRIVIEMKSGADAEVALNQLWRSTQLQTTVSIILIAIVDGRPETLSIKRMIELYLEHRVVVIRRRTEHLLERAEERLHIVEGLQIALINIDDVIEIIRSSENVQEARERLMRRYELTEPQVDAIVGMRLRSLVGLEQLRIEKELEDLTLKIAEYKGILADRSKVEAIIREDLLDVRNKYGDERRTSISEDAAILEREDLIPEERVLVTISDRGYVKRLTPDSFRAQARGGKGVIGADLMDQDVVNHIFLASTHDYMLFFTDRGLVYWLKVFMVPEMQRTARGRALVNVLQLGEDETITGVIPVSEFEQEGYLLMATRRGKVKKTRLDAFGKRGSGGIIALDLAPGDRLIGVRKTTGDDEVMLGTRRGYAIRFHEKDVRTMGRGAGGVRGIRLDRGDEVVDMALVREGARLLTLCEKGYGKRTELKEYPRQRRGGRGRLDIRTTERNGLVVAMREVSDDQELIVVTEKGKTVRTPVSAIRCIGRRTQGVRIVSTNEGDVVSGVVAVGPQNEEYPAGVDDAEGAQT